MVLINMYTNWGYLLGGGGCCGVCEKVEILFEGGVARVGGIKGIGFQRQCDVA